MNGPQFKIFCLFSFGPSGVHVPVNSVWGELVRAKCKQIPDELWSCQANIVTTKLLFFENIRRRLVRVLKQGVYTDKNKQNTNKSNRIGDPPWSPGGVFRF